MALNVPLTHGPSGQFPLPFPGEIFLLTRDKTELTIRDQSRHAKKLKGRIFMTNLRMVFLIREADQAKAGAQTFEAPFRGLWDEKLHQPIFGVIHLTASIQYYDEQPFTGDLTMRLDFAQGGVNTFLPMFNNVLYATRVQLQREQAQQQAPPPPPISTHTGSTSATEYYPDQNAAFVDPQDPSLLYTTQPAVEEEQRRQDTPSWHPSAGGLRRR